MRECRADHPSLVAYLDRELDPVSERWIEAHVEMCSRCGSELAQLRQAALLLRESLTAPGRGEEDWRGALARAKERARRPSPPFLEFWWWLLDDPLPAFAAATLVCLAVAEALSFLELEEEALALFSYLIPLGLS